MIIFYFISIIYFVIPTESVLDCIIKHDWENKRNAVLNKINIANDKYEMTHDLHDLESYDFVVVGAGSAGSTLAADLLKKTSNTRILLVEAGTHVDNQLLCDYTKAINFWGPNQFNWYFESIPQKDCDNRKMPLSAGRGLGGSSIINAMLWVRGDRNDFNEWAHSADDPSWNYINILPLFIEHERYPNGSVLRGKRGRVFSSKILSDNDDNKVYREALYRKYKQNNDYNSLTMYGIGNIQLNVEPDDFVNPTKGVRQDAFSTQLRYFVGTSRLHILTESEAVRVSLDKNKKVEYLEFEHKSKRYRVRASRETILSAGALQTPLILMRSGIGSCDELAELNITCQVNLKGVGKNLQNHLGLFSFLKLKPEHMPDKNVLLQLFDGRIKPAGQKYLKPKFQVFTYYVKENVLVSPEYLNCGLLLLHPNSAGSVKLASLNLHDKPIIDLKCLATEFDRAQMLEGFRVTQEYARELMKTGHIEGYVAPFGDYVNDTEAMDYIRKQVSPQFHYCGTCKMGKSSDENAVVDSKLRVFGVTGLRVADASIMPEVTSGNTHNPVMIIGAQCAKFLIQEYF